MIVKLFSKPLEKTIWLYVIFVIGNATTGIINDLIDNIILHVDDASAGLLNIIRTLFNLRELQFLQS